jgi:nitroimidazol reductase NimA-like FMN-containing flavoprotein (pyridoxamine 5'-phosphate oxidase superfamily)
VVKEPPAAESPAEGRLEVMPDDECVRRLKAQQLGRVGVVDREVKPLIFPVNYFFDEGIVAFRTGPGSKLDLAPGAAVCFEIDGWDDDSGVGWSVMAKGIAHDITQPRGSPMGRVRFWPVRPLAPGSRESWIGIWLTDISGRWFRKTR